MRNIIFVLVLICVIKGNIFAQTQPGISWEYCYGGTGYDHPYSIIPTQDNGYIVVGESDSNDGFVTGQHGTNQTSDVWIVKIDHDGLFQWGNCYGGTSGEFGLAVLQTLDGSYVIAGQASSNNGDVTGLIGGSDVWLLKLDSLGGIIWQNTYGGTLADAAYGLTETMDGGYALTGISMSNDVDVSNHHGPPGSHYDVWVIKTDSIGGLQWQTSLGGSLDDDGKAIVQAQDSCIYVVANTVSNDGDVTGIHSPGNTDIWIVKLNQAGIKVWAKCFGGTGSESSWELKLKSNGNIVVVGQTDSNNGNVSGLHGVNDYWVFEIDSSGALLWQECYGGYAFDVGISITETSDNGMAILGTSRSSDIYVTGNHGYDDLWVVKIDSLGTILWEKSLGGSQNDYGVKIIEDFNKDLLVLGAVYSADSNITMNNGFLDYWIVKLDDPLLGLNEHIKPDKVIAISPNPFHFSARVDFENNQHNKHEILIYDSMGKLIQTIKTTDNHVFIEKQYKRNGIYSIVLLNIETQMYHREKLIIY